jgi:4-hydroxy-tetrahydrodipicolinate reductase
MTAAGAPADGSETTLSVVVTGATGRMGQTVVETAVDRGVEVVAAVSHTPGATVAGVPVESAADLSTLLSAREADAVVDFTAPEAAARYADRAAEAGVPLVTGTTGFADRTPLERAAERVPVVHASNFAPGAAVLRELLRAAAAALPSYDVEIVETHHAGKRDAPSGTALSLVEAVEDARPGDTDTDTDADGAGGLRRVDGRSGTAPRDPGAVGVHAVRAGAVTGEHTALLAGDDEQVRVEHRVGDRSAFAAGALRAARAVTDRAPGLYGPEVVR